MVMHAVQLVGPQLETELLETHAPAHRWNPVTQLNEQLVPLQVAVEFGGGVHGVQLAPHVAVAVFETHPTPAHMWKPASQTPPQLVPSQVAVPFGTAGHGAQLVVPQLEGRLFDTHAPAHAWKPALQTIPHVLPMQLAEPFVGTGQAWPHVPQFIRSVARSAQLVPHAVVGDVQVNPHARPVPASAIGTHMRGDAQGIVHAPQCALLVKGSSQPLASLPSQSPSPGMHVSTQRPATH